MHLRIASLFLHPFTGVEPDPQEALAILDRILDHGLAGGDDEGSVPQFRKGGPFRPVNKQSLREIQRERDELRAQARALLGSRGRNEEKRP